MQQVQSVKIVDPSVNPAPLGLLGFGMTTILLNLANAGLIPLSSMIMGMGIFVGGVAQIIVGIMEWKKNNTFGMTAFTSYGLFWMALVAIWLLPKIAGVGAADPISMGYFLVVWGIYTMVMFIGTLKQNRALQLVFFTLTILFFLLAGADFTGSSSLKQIAGFEGIVCGMLACYTCLALVLNEVYGKTILPIGPVKK